MQFLIDRTMSVIRSEGVGWEVNVLNYNSKFVSKERTCCSITFPSFLSQNLFSIKQKIIHGVEIDNVDARELSSPTFLFCTSILKHSLLQRRLEP